MSVRNDLIKLIVFTVFAILVLWVLGATLLNTVAGDTKSYTAEFTDVSGLREGDSVRMAGVRVGRVDSMKLDGTHAAVTMSIAANQPVFQNTGAIIRYQDLVGQRYVAMVPGAGPAGPLPDGGVIPLDRTQPSIDLSTLLNGFQPLYQVIKPAEVNQLSENLLQVLQGTAPDIGPLLEQTARLTNTVADRDQIIGQVIVNLNEVLTQLAGKGPQLDGVLAQAHRLVDGLNSNSNTIFDSLDRVRDASNEGRHLLSDIRPDLRYDIDRAGDVADDVFGRNRQELRGTLAGFPAFLDGLSRVSSYGSWINLYVCHGAIVPAPGLPPLRSDVLAGGHPKHTEVCR
ncbi:MAG TPA: MCE family protein [Pseudonocardia sp.]|jgi:phospholipid/cholesterol/gamma-HCH transport system substrate-binding protein|nr:MCE family protein [Pseudonocardia sp.]